MDELDLIRTLRDETPDQAARANARRALRDRIEAPAAEPAWPWRPRRRWLVIPAALAAAAAVVIALVTGVDDASIGPAPATAREALERAAVAAEARPDRPLAPAEYYYVRDRSAYVSSHEGRRPPAFSASVPTERETWTNRRGDVRFSERVVGPATFPGPRDRRRWMQAGSPELFDDRPEPNVQRHAGQGFSAGGSTLTYAQLQALPGDGQAMYRRLIELARDNGPSPDVEAFVIIGDLLRSSPVPAHVRAGLYRAAAYIRDVRYAGEVRDELGRRGLAVELEAGGERRRLVFEPGTSRVLVEQDVLTERQPDLDADPGYVSAYRLVLEQGVVQGQTERP